jgi:cytochrome c peroxidase
VTDARALRARRRSLFGAGLALAAACAGWVGGTLAAPDARTVQINPGGPPSVVAERIGATPRLTERTDPAEATFRPDPALSALGKRIFFDTRLSQPQGLSCAGCHDPARAFTSTLNAPSLAGPRTPQGSRPGHFSARTAPSLLYVRYVPRRHFYQDDDALVPSPFGGLFTDGRADTLAEQARGPLFDRDEMNNASPRSLLRKLRGTDLAPAMSLAFGPQVLQDPERAVKGIGLALQAYLQSDEMAPFSSRFDDYLRKRTPLNPQEMRGLALFKNPDRGNCMSCHTLSDTSSRPERSLFTDFGYDAIAVPRNLSLPANRDPRRFDNGLCRATALARARPVVRLLPHAGAAQRGGAPELHAQRRVHHAARRGRVLRHALDRPGQVVPRQADLRRRACGLQGQHQRQFHAHESPPRAAAGADRCGDRRHQRLPRHPDRCTLCGGHAEAGDEVAAAVAEVICAEARCVTFLLEMCTFVTANPLWRLRP